MSLPNLPGVRLTKEEAELYYKPIGMRKKENPKTELEEKWDLFLAELQAIVQAERDKKSASNRSK
jgi:hypothetical protein